MAIGRIFWLINRVRVMSAAEIFYRIRTFARSKLTHPSARQWPGTSHASIDAVKHGTFFTHSTSALFVPPCEIRTDDRVRLLNGEISVFRRWVPVSDSPDFWHRDPFSKALWPQEHYTRISYRPSNAVGDVRVVWEIGRLQHLFALAVIAHTETCHRQTAIGLIESHLRGWYVSNPPSIGVHYISAMEESLRLISLFHTFDLIRDWVSSEFTQLFIEIVINHAWHIERRLSLHSSAGNHTIAEAVGLLYAGVLLPECPWAGRWKRTAITLLRQEAPRQIDADGGGIEQATWYLLFITDLLGLAQALLACRREPAVPAVDVAVDRARTFLDTLAGAPDDLPRIGDADDGFALCPELGISWSSNRPSPRQHTFRVAGLSVASYSGHDRLVFLHNPLGMAPLFGHGHADALSILFRWNGEDLLIDTGTYQYGGDPAYRRYFRSAQAHNTGAVNDLDHAVQLTPFSWSRAYECRLLLAEHEPDQCRLVARQDAYRHVGSLHWRGVLYRRHEYLLLLDRFVVTGTKRISINWHFGCPVTRDASRENTFNLATDNSGLIALTIFGGTTSMHCGQSNPLLGWQSIAYGLVRPCATLVTAAETSSEHHLVTALWLGKKTDLSHLEHEIAWFKDICHE